MFPVHLRGRFVAHAPSIFRSFSRSMSGQVFWLAVFAVLAVAGYVPVARAQTAHFGGVMQTLGSGFTNPFGVAVDASGNVYVADEATSTINEIMAVNGGIPANPTINTLGSGFLNPQGVAVDGKGDVFVADTGHNEIKEIVAVGGSIPASSPAINILGSGFNGPQAVAVDASGDVYVADTNNNAIKEMVAVGGSIPTSSPTIRTLGSGFGGPAGVALDASGDVFVADTSNNEIKEIVAVNGSIPANPTINTLGSGFTLPFGVAVDASGNVYAADTYNNEIKEMVAANGGIPASPTILTLGSGFNFPAGMAVDTSGNVYVADFGNNAVKEISPANFGSVTVAKSSAQQSLTFNFDSSGALAATPYVVLTQGAANLDFQAAVSQSSSVCVTGHSYSVGDTCTVNVTFTPSHPGIRMGAVQLMGSGGVPIATGVARGIGAGPQVIFPSNGAPVVLGSGFNSPTGVAVDARNNVYVADRNSNAIKELIAVKGSLPASPAINTLGSGFSQPTGVAVDASGNVFVADTGNSAIKEIAAVNGAIPASPTILTLGSGFSFPTGVAVDARGNVYVADYDNSAVKEMVAVDGGIPASPTILTLGSGFAHPENVAVDANGNVYVADYGNSAIKEMVAVNGGIPANPTIRTLGSGFKLPYGVAVDASGNVFVADSNNNAVKEIVAVNGSIPANPTILTLGSGFGFPQEVAVDASGNVYVANSNSNLMNELPYATAPSLSFASTAVGSTSSDSPRTVTVANDGNANLSFTVPATGLNPSVSNSNFTLDSISTCPQLDPSSSVGTLAPGPSCTYLVSFSPVSAGSTAGTLAITDNSLNASPSVTQTINLSGSATVSVPSTPASFTMSASNVGLTVPLDGTNSTTLQLTPIGGYNGTVTLSCANLPPDTTCTFAQRSVTFSGVNPVSVALTFQNNGFPRLAAARSMPTPLSPILPALAFWWPGGLVGIAAFAKKRKLLKPQRRWMHLCLLLVMTGALALGFTGCIATPNASTTQVSITATPTSGAGISPQTVTLNLTIEGVTFGPL